MHMRDSVYVGLYLLKIGFPRITLANLSRSR